MMRQGARIISPSHSQANIVDFTGDEHSMRLAVLLNCALQGAPTFTAVKEEAHNTMAMTTIYLSLLQQKKGLPVVRVKTLASQMLRLISVEDDNLTYLPSSESSGSSVHT